MQSLARNIRLTCCRYGAEREIVSLSVLASLFSFLFWALPIAFRPVIPPFAVLSFQLLI
jgi:hypothetical protein